MKCLLHSNSPWTATGYGQQTAQLAKNLQANGHQVAISAFYGLQGAQLNWDGVEIFPAGMDPYGNDVLLPHAGRWFDGDLKGGLVITLIDAWVLDPNNLAQLNVAMWVPVDHTPAPPKVIEHVAASGAVPVAMSRHGERMLTDAGLDPVYAPHGIDTQVLHPIDQAKARDVLGLPHDKFIVGMVAANKGMPPRKGFPELMQAFAAFHAKHPDSMLYLHTEMAGQCNGLNLTRLADACGLPPGVVAFMPQYQGFILGQSPAQMANVYSALDVLANPAYGEGFGCPIVEAQACGVPVIVTNDTSMPELAGAGWMVEGQRSWTPQHSWWTVPDVGRLTWALKESYKHRGQLAGAARTFAEGYDDKRVYAEHWVPALAEIDRRLFQPSVGEVVVEPAPERVAA